MFWVCFWGPNDTSSRSVFGSLGNGSHRPFGDFFVDIFEGWTNMNQSHGLKKSRMDQRKTCDSCETLSISRLRFFSMIV